jgi:hypothetical protein
MVNKTPENVQLVPSKKGIIIIIIIIIIINPVEYITIKSFFKQFILNTCIITSKKYLKNALSLKLNS